MHSDVVLIQKFTIGKSVVNVREMTISNIVLLQIKRVSHGLDFS